MNQLKRSYSTGEFPIDGSDLNRNVKALRHPDDADDEYDDVIQGAQADAPLRTRAHQTRARSRQRAASAAAAVRSRPADADDLE